MKRILLPLLLALACYSPAFSQSLLWRITHPEAPDRVSYVYGTMHVNAEFVYQMGDSAIAAFQTSTAFAAEVEIDRDSVMMMAQKLLRMSEENKVTISPKKDLTAPQRTNLQKMCKLIEKEYNNNEMTFSLIELMTIGQKYYSKDYMTSLDQALWYYAKWYGHEMYGLESMADQVNTLASLVDTDYLRNSLGIDVEAIYAKMQKLYETRDIQSLRQVTEEYNGSNPRYIEDFLDNRNVVMANKIDILAYDTDLFSAIGVAHLDGKKGVLALLREKGWIVEPVLDNSRTVPEGVSLYRTSCRAEYSEDNPFAELEIKNVAGNLYAPVTPDVQVQQVLSREEGAPINYYAVAMENVGIPHIEAIIIAYADSIPTDDPMQMFDGYISGMEKQKIFTKICFDVYKTSVDPETDEEIVGMHDAYGKFSIIGSGSVGVVRGRVRQDGGWMLVMIISDDMNAELIAGRYFAMMR